MNKICLNLDRTKKYVVACSFGPDSMALLSAAIENGLKIVVAHVNYRKRKAALFEQQSLEKYCNEKGVKFYALDLIGIKHVGNFQDWARKARYKFFKEVLEKEDANAVLVAHQQDDVIETYLMQEKRGNITKNLGIPVENDLFGIRIIRPLLDFSKEELKIYNDQNGVPYSIDESNLSDDYLRNKIRHNVVEKMSEEDREKIIKEIQSKKRAQVEFKTIWTSQEFNNLTYEQIVRLVDHFMNKTSTHRDLSEKFVEEIKKAFSNKKNTHFDITSTLRLEKDYDEIYLVNTSRVKSYNYLFEKELKNDLFEIDFSNGGTDRKIPDGVGELIIKNIDKNSELIIKNYSSSINRLFIDWKVPHFLREVWPGIYDKNNELLYVPRYRKTFVDNHKSKFVFNTEYFTEF